MTDASFGIIPVWRDAGVDRFLLIESQNAHVWSFPKGHKEADETDIETALRELREETGIVDAEIFEDVSYLEKYTFYRDGHKVEKTVKFFVGRVADSKITIQEKEIANYKWATYEEALGILSFPRPKEILKEVVENF